MTYLVGFEHDRSRRRRAARRDGPQAATDGPAAIDASLGEERGRTAQRRQQRTLRCDVGANRLRRRAVARARDQDERRRRRRDRRDGERAQTRWAMRVRRVAGSRRRDAGARRHAGGGVSVGTRCGTVVARLRRRWRRRVGADRREQMQRQRDERDSEAACHPAILHRVYRVHRGWTLQPQLIFPRSVALTLGRPKR